MNAEAELMDAIKRADEDASKRKGIKVDIPAEVTEQIEKDTKHFREVRYQEAAIEILQPTKHLVWKASDPFPPKHDPVPQQANKGNSVGARKYVGETAEGYDAKRENSEKWKAEDRIMAELLSDLPPETTVLDCPCGTGRFLRLYEESGFNVICMDASEDMLKQAHAKGSVMKNHYALGDARDTKLPDNEVDIAAMIRLTRWLMENPDDCRAAIREMQRVAKQRVIFTARVRDHQFACTYDIINSALDGWKIHRDLPIAEENLRMIELRPM